jgi:hypothetical protein
MIDREAARAAEDAARAGAGRLARKAIAYSDCVARTVAAAKQAGGGADIWAELEAMIDVPNFVRYGAFREVTGWAEYRELLTGWATTTSFWYNFRRLSETGDMAFWEVEEHNTPEGGEESVVNSMSAFQFNAEGKICRLDIYLQADIMRAGNTNWSKD